jgi:hypothetical protein
MPIADVLAKMSEQREDAVCSKAPGRGDCRSDILAREKSRCCPANKPVPRGALAQP